MNYLCRRKVVKFSDSGNILGVIHIVSAQPI